MKSLLSPKDVALAIGVSESSLKRWADEGLIHASRTVGGHRRIALQDAIKFVRETQTPILRADMLGMPELRVPDPNTDPSSAADDLFAALHDGDPVRVRGLILGAYAAGRSISAIFDQVVRKAMHRIGETWKHDEKGIFIEHRATDICLGAINALRWLMQDPAREQASGSTPPVAVGGAPTSDPYLIPSLMSAVTLAEVGYKDVNLGPETPIDTLRKAIDALNPKLVWLSVSVTRINTPIRDEIDTLAPWLEARSISFVVGGRGAASLGLTPRNNLQIAESMAELAAYAQGLRVAHR